MNRILFGLLCLATVSVATAQGVYSARGANFYVQTRDWDALFQYSSRWTEQQPHDARGWYYLGTAYVGGLQQPSNAIAPLQRATQLKGDWDSAWSALGAAYLQAQRYEDASHAFEQAVKLAPASPNNWISLASAYASFHEMARAEQALDAGQVQASKWASNADWYAFGNGYADVGCYAKAAAAYRHALDLDERVSEAWNNLGVAEERLGHKADALVHYQRAAALGDELGESNALRLQSPPTQVRSAQAHAAQRTPAG
jgi:tetratricopeptide (TPR) repeat protein